MTKNLLDDVPAPEQIKTVLAAVVNEALPEAERYVARSRLRGMLAVTQTIPARKKLAEVMRYVLRKNNA